jgi:hypothetical protein
MRPTFLLNSRLQAVSCFVNKEETSGPTVGIRARLVKDFETPYGQISAGTKGFIDFVDPETGLVSILMEGIEPALLHWNNRLFLVPFETEDLLGCLVLDADRVAQVLQENGLGNVAQLRTG